MNRFNRRIFSKSLLFIAVFAAATHSAAALAQEGESGQAQSQNVMALDPFGIPPSMSVEEFNKHMEGAREAALTLEGFVALRAEEPAPVVLDTRSPAAYGYQRIKGSLNLPLTEMTEHTLPALLPDRTRPVVLVCDESFGPTRRLSMTLQAWPVLKANGYTRVYRLNLWRPEAEGAPMHGQEEIEKHVPLEGSFKPLPSAP